jgi:hypothetical protein
VSDADEGGADAELQYVEVNEDTEEPQDKSADEGKPRCISQNVFGNLCNYLRMFVHLRPGVEMKP